MLCRDILTAALKLLGESGGIEDHPDYAERSPYIIASFVSEASEADAKYRLANGLSEASVEDVVYISLEEDFPLSGRFFSSAVYYLASLLIADDSPELSDKYYDKYCDGVLTILSSLPFLPESIVRKY